MNVTEACDNLKFRVVLLRAGESRKAVQTFVQVHGAVGQGAAGFEVAVPSTGKDLAEASELLDHRQPCERDAQAHRSWATWLKADPQMHRPRAAGHCLSKSARSNISNLNTG